MTTTSDGHTHIATFRENGNGYTDEAQDGHWHRVIACDVQPANGHTHELTDTRAAVEREVRPRRRVAAA